MRKQIERWINDHPKQVKYGLFGLAGLLLVWLGWIWWRVDSAVVRTDPNANASDVTAIEFVESPLTGVKVSEDLAKRPIISAQVENSPDARPQSGLNEAGVVFEAIAEGGITRFNLMFQESSPKKIGPIRSLRPYFIDWLLGFDAAVVHVGGSTEAKSMIPSLGVKSLDVGGAYYRDSSRYAPHNAYSSYSTLADIVKRLGYNKGPVFTPIARKEANPLETPKASTINVDISSNLYNLTYRYDKECNCYPRNMGGNPHKDRETGKHLSPDVVVVIKAPHSVTDGVGHLKIPIVGSGTGWVFQDGNVTKVNWKKAARDKQITFTNSQDKPVALNPGQTWITVIPSDKSVSYTP